MKTSFLKLHAILWVVAILAMIIDYNMTELTVIDLNVHDTYFVMAKIHVYTNVVIYFGMVGLLYWLLHKARKKTSQLLDRIYVTLMLMGIIALTIVPLVDVKDIFSPNTRGIWSTSAILLILAAQLVLMINFIGTLFKKRVSYL